MSLSNDKILSLIEEGKSRTEEVKETIRARKGDKYSAMVELLLVNVQLITVIDFPEPVSNHMWNSCFANAAKVLDVPIKELADDVMSVVRQIQHINTQMNKELK